MEKSELLKVMLVIHPHHPIKSSFIIKEFGIWVYLKTFIYQHYLEKVRLKESEMSEIQRIETKRAFVAGMSEMFWAMISGLGVSITLEDYKKELTNFWEEEVKSTL